MFSPLYSNAVETENLSIQSNWLSVTTDGFVDLTPNAYENDLFLELGGYDLIEFENLGLLIEDTTNDILIYGGKITFGFEMTALTSVDYQDKYPNIDINSQYEDWFFGLNRYQLLGAYYTEYDFSYREVDYGSINVPHDYSGYIPLTVSMKDLTITSGSMTINGITLSTPEYIFDVMEVDTGLIRSDVIGDYEDHFIGINNIDEGKITFTVLTDLLPSQTAVVDWYENAGIGWQAGPIVSGQTLQQSVIYGGGGTYQNPNPNINKEFTFNVNMELKPSAYEYVQYNDITKGSIILWEWGFFAGNIDTVYGPSTQSLKRVVAVHVINHMIHWDYTVEVYVYATIPSTAEITETVLSDPYLRYGDFVWDTSITGDYDVQVGIVVGSMLLELLPWIIGIVIVIIIILVVYIGFKLLMTKTIVEKGKDFGRQPVSINIEK